MTEKLILEKLDNLEKQNTKQDKFSEKMEVKIDELAAAVNLIAVQNQRISHVEIDVAELKERCDEMFSQDGVVNRIKLWQATCPRTSIDMTLNRQWAIIVLFCTVGSTIITGILLKITGVI